MKEFFIPFLLAALVFSGIIAVVGGMLAFIAS